MYTVGHKKGATFIFTITTNSKVKELIEIGPHLPKLS